MHDGWYKETLAHLNSVKRGELLNTRRTLVDLQKSAKGGPAVFDGTQLSADELTALIAAHERRLKRLVDFEDDIVGLLSLTKTEARWKTIQAIDSLYENEVQDVARAMKPQGRWWKRLAKAEPAFFWAGVALSIGGNVLSLMVHDPNWGSKPTWYRHWDTVARSVKIGTEVLEVGRRMYGKRVLNWAQLRDPLGQRHLKYAGIANRVLPAVNYLASAVLDASAFTLAVIDEDWVDVTGYGLLVLGDVTMAYAVITELASLTPWGLGLVLLGTAIVVGADQMESESTKGLATFLRAPMKDGTTAPGAAIVQHGTAKLKEHLDDIEDALLMLPKALWNTTNTEKLEARGVPENMWYLIIDGFPAPSEPPPPRGDTGGTGADSVPHNAGMGGGENLGGAGGNQQ